MSERTRDFLRPEFRDGERPSGTDFTDLIDSCVNKISDGVSVDGDGNLVLSRGLKLSNSAGTVAGGLRFFGGQVQFHDGTNWVNLASGGGGGFQPIPATTAVAYGGGNVGIGASFTTAAPPAYRLDVPLGPNTGSTNDQVRFGNAVCASGSGAFTAAAVFSHSSHASNSNFALRQASNGAVHVNAAAGQVVSIRQGGASVRLGVSTAGNVIVGGESDLTGIPAPGTALLQVAGDAFKSTGNASWLITSDERLKDDVRNLDAGLAELLRVRPVRFRYNGRAGTSAGADGVGVIGQEIETVFPETIRRGSVPDDPGLDGLRIFDPSMLTFVLINAVKELAARVEHLEQALAAAPSPA